METRIFDRETALNAAASILNPELRKLVEYVVGLIPPDSPLRTEAMERVAGVVASMVEAQKKGKSPLVAAAIEKLSDALQLAGVALAQGAQERSRQATTAKTDWRGEFLTKTPERLKAASEKGGEALEAEVKKVEAELAALQVIEDQLYPKPPPKPSGGGAGRVLFAAGNMLKGEEQPQPKGECATIEEGVINVLQGIKTGLAAFWKGPWHRAWGKANHLTRQAIIFALVVASIVLAAFVFATIAALSGHNLLAGIIFAVSFLLICVMTLWALFRLALSTKKPLNYAAVIAAAVILWRWVTGQRGTTASGHTASATGIDSTKKGLLIFLALVMTVFSYLILVPVGSNPRLFLSRMCFLIATASFAAAGKTLLACATGAVLFFFTITFFAGK